MMNKITILTVAFSLLLAINSSAQWSGGISNLTAQESIKNHYEHLQKLSALPQQKMEWMDTIAYPPSLYKNSTMLFALSKPAYLTSDQINFLVNSVQFPANSSQQTRAELDFLLDLQAKRTPQKVERVMNIAKIGYWPDAGMLKSHPSFKQNLNSLFFEVHEVMGDGYTPDKYPKTIHLLKKVMIDTRLMEFAVKYHLLRARPYQLTTKLKPLQIMSSPSYASGHTLWAYIQAYILAELIPEKRIEFIALAYEIGFSREIMGVHYPSDEETARQLAHRIVWLIWHTQPFHKDFTNAKKEWK